MDIHGILLRGDKKMSQGGIDIKEIRIVKKDGKNIGVEEYDAFRIEFRKFIESDLDLLIIGGNRSWGEAMQFEWFLY